MTQRTGQQEIRPLGKLPANAAVYTRTSALFDDRPLGRKKNPMGQPIAEGSGGSALDPATKNLRQWVGLLFILFLVLDLAAVQYGSHLAQSSPLEPSASAGQVALSLKDIRGHAYTVYPTQPQRLVYYGLLVSTGLSLLATLALIVGHGIHLLWNYPRVQDRARRRDADPPPLPRDRDAPASRGQPRRPRGHQPGAQAAATAHGRRAGQPRRGKGHRS